MQKAINKRKKSSNEIPFVGVGMLFNCIIYGKEEIEGMIEVLVIQDNWIKVFYLHKCFISIEDGKFEEDKHDILWINTHSIHSARLAERKEVKAFNKIHQYFEAQNEVEEICGNR